MHGTNVNGKTCVIKLIPTDVGIIRLPYRQLMTLFGLHLQELLYSYKKNENFCKIIPVICYEFSF